MEEAMSLVNPHRETAVGDILRAQASDVPDKTFLRMRGIEVSYGSMDMMTDSVASSLRELGVSRGDIVSAMLDNTSEFVIMWLAAAKLGAVFSPHNTAFRGRLLAHTLELVSPRVAVVDEKYLTGFMEAAKEGPLDVLVVRGADGERPDEQRSLLSFDDLLSGTGDVSADISAADPLMLLHTSGTTGPSKACMLTHYYAATQAHIICRELGLTVDDVLYCPYPLFHIDAAILTVVAAMMNGSTAAIGERFSVSRFWDEVRDFNASVFDFMGATLTMLWNEAPTARDADNPVRLAWGVPLPDFTPAFEKRFDLRIATCYGSTEAGVGVWYPPNGERREGACGKPVYPYRIAIVDEDDWQVGPNTVGEIVMRTDEAHVLMTKYYGMPEATGEAFRNLWLHTGDLGQLDEDEYLYFVGRKKDSIRRRGENISCFEVEEQISSHDAVLECAVFGVESHLTEEDVMAVVVVDRGKVLRPTALRRFLRLSLPSFMIPRYIRFVKSLPRTVTGKVEKHVLRKIGVTDDTWDSELHL